MKTIIEQDTTEGLESLIGETVTIFCALYFYTGKLIGVSSTCVKLQDPYIVYETGSFTDNAWKDAQKMPHKYWYISMGMIESFGIMK